MPGQRTMGMTVVGIVHLVAGIVGAAAGVMMLLRGAGIVDPAGIDGASPSLVVGFGMARLAICAILVVAGIGVFGLHPGARRLSLQYALYWVLISFIEPPALGNDYSWRIWLGMAYPLVVIWVFMLPAWRAAFSPAQISPD